MAAAPAGIREPRTGAIVPRARSVLKAPHCNLPETNMAKTFDPDSRAPENVPDHGPYPCGPGDSRERDSDLGGVKSAAASSGRAADACPPPENDVAFDEGKTTEVDFERPPPADEGDNPDEQAAAREQARRSIPPRSRVKPGPH